MGERTDDLNAFNNQRENPRQKQKNPLNTEPSARNTKEPHQMANPTGQEKPEQQADTPEAQNPGYQGDANFDLDWDSDFDPSLRED